MLDGKQLIKDLYFPNSESRSPSPGNKAIARVRPQRSSSWNHYFLWSLFFFLPFFLLVFGLLLALIWSLATFARCCWPHLPVGSLRENWFVLNLCERSLSSLSALASQRCSAIHTGNEGRERLDACPTMGNFLGTSTGCSMLSPPCQVCFIIIWPLIHTHTWVEGPSRIIKYLITTKI